MVIDLAIASVEVLATTVFVAYSGLVAFISGTLEIVNGFVQCLCRLSALTTELNASGSKLFGGENWATVVFLGGGRSR